MKYSSTHYKAKAVYFFKYRLIGSLGVGKSHWMSPTITMFITKYPGGCIHEAALSIRYSNYVRTKSDSIKGKTIKKSSPLQAKK